MPEDQIMRKEIPEDKLKDVISFASVSPDKRLESIRSFLGVSFLSQLIMTFNDFILLPGTSLWPIRICSRKQR